jgi:hypothetical protein
MRYVLIVRRITLLIVVGKCTANLPNALPLLHVEATPTVTEVEVMVPLAVQVNVRSRTKVDIVVEDPERAVPTIKEKNMPMKLI